MSLVWSLDFEGELGYMYDSGEHVGQLDPLAASCPSGETSTDEVQDCPARKSTLEFVANMQLWMFMFCLAFLTLSDKYN
jgi:hypothetical protein